MAHESRWGRWVPSTSVYRSRTASGSEQPHHSTTSSDHFIAGLSRGLSTIPNITVFINLLSYTLQMWPKSLSFLCFIRSTAMQSFVLCYVWTYGIVTATLLKYIRFMQLIWWIKIQFRYHLLQLWVNRLDKNQEGGHRSYVATENNQWKPPALANIHALLSEQLTRYSIIAVVHTEHSVVITIFTSLEMGCSKK